MSGYEPLQNIAYEHIRNMISHKEMKPGVIYSETKLAAQLSISRTPVRDALTRLTMERYIDILPNRGYRLHNPDETDLHEARHVRIMTETYCGTYLCDHYKEQRPEALRAVRIMKEMLAEQTAIVKGSITYDIERFWQDDLAFHTAIVEYLAIPSITGQYNSFMHFHMPQYLEDSNVAERHASTLGEHKKILEAIESGDTRAFAEAIRNHIDSSTKVFIAQQV